MAMRDIEKAKKVALDIMDSLIVSEYKYNKCTPMQISHKYNIPLLYVYDVTNTMQQYKDTEIYELKKWFNRIDYTDKQIEEIQSLNIIELTTIREAIIDMIFFGNKDNRSSGHRAIKEWLDYNKIYYYEEKTFPDLIDKGSLRFDFYIPSINMCIEFDGEQHFKPVGHWGGDDAFKAIQKRDKIKDDYCIDNGINLIRIQYTNEIKIDTILTEAIHG